MNSSRLALSFALVGCALPAFSQTLKFNPPVGKTFRYLLTTSTDQTIQGRTNNSKQQLMLQLRIVGNSGGKVTTETTISDVKVTLPEGNPMANMKEQIEGALSGVKIASTFDSRGRLLTNKAVSGDPMIQNAIMGITGGLGTMYALPPGSAAVGTKWTVPYDLAKIMGGMAAGVKMSGGKSNVNLSLKRYENSGKRRLAVIAMTLAVKMQIQGSGPQAGASVSNQMNTTGTIRIDAATGLPFSTVTVGNGVTTVGANKMTQKTTTTMKLVS